MVATNQQHCTSPTYQLPHPTYGSDTLDSSPTSTYPYLCQHIRANVKSEQCKSLYYCLCAFTTLVPKCKKKVRPCALEGQHTLQIPNVNLTVPSDVCEIVTHNINIYIPNHIMLHLTLHLYLISTSTVFYNQ